MLYEATELIKFHLLFAARKERYTRCKGIKKKKKQRHKHFCILDGAIQAEV